MDAARGSTPGASATCNPAMDLSTCLHCTAPSAQLEFALHCVSFGRVFLSEPCEPNPTEDGGPGLCVLVVAGVERIFFPVAAMGLCFGFVLKTWVITKRYFCYC